MIANKGKNMIYLGFGTSSRSEIFDENLFLTAASVNADAELPKDLMDMIGEVTSETYKPRYVTDFDEYLKSIKK